MTAPPPVRHLVASQGLYVLGSSIDLTLTAIVGERLAPSRWLATVPYALIPIAAAASTFVLSRAVSRWGYRRVLVAAPLGAAAGGALSAAAVALESFALFCVGTALVGVYVAGAGYYRYVAAESWPQERARAVSTLLAGGLAAAVVGPAAATALAHATPTPYVGSYLLVAASGCAASAWNARLPEVGAAARHARGDAGRSRARLWRQRDLLLGVASAALAALTMTAMMTAGPLAGESMGHSTALGALAVQCHMVGMFAPGFLAARWIGRVGAARVAASGGLVLAAAGLAGIAGTGSAALVAAMTLVGIGWNLAYSGGSALIAGSYEPSERARVQPYAEAVITASQVVGALSAGAASSRVGWAVMGGAVAVVGVAVLGAASRARRVAPADAG